MAKTGRPTKYTQELADAICDRLSDGVSLRTVCLDKDMPDKSQVFRWIRTNEEFRDQYTRAKQESANAMGEDILDIVDDGTNDWMEKYDRKGNAIGWRVNGEAVQRSKLRADTRIWLMSKMQPKVYGNKLDVTSDGDKLEAGQITGYVLPGLVDGHKDKD